MDFMEKLQDKINELPQPSPRVLCQLGYLGTGESLVLYPLPGSSVVQEYMDGTKDWRMNYEIAMKSKSQSKISAVLWTIQTELEKLKTLESDDGSFQFENITIPNKPFINQIDEQNYFVFLLNVQAKITVFEEE